VDSYRAKEISVIPMILPASYLPIIVVEYDNICRCQIDTASNTSCEQEDELLVTRLVVLVDPADRSSYAVPPSIRWYSVKIEVNQ
jgi:hypothetical protein